MQFAHIAPTAYLKPLNLDKYPCHLLLAHLLESDAEYLKFYQSLPEDAIVIQDNSAFELYRRGLPMFDGDKLLDLAKKINADYIVMPDYPGEECGKTAAAAIKYGEVFKNEGYGTFFVPQSRIGHREEYISSFAWAASSPYVDYIGMSILGIPNAYGVDGNDIQRFTSRWAMFNELYGRGLLQLAKKNGKKIHCLGMTDGPNEILLLADYIRKGYIDTWDSSAAVWAGIEDVAFDTSPTGLVNGKVKSHVDFDIAFDDSKLDTITRNMHHIDSFVAALQPKVTNE